MMPHLVDITGTSQKSDSNKTFGEPSLSDGIISALAFEKIQQYYLFQILIDI